MQVEKALLIFNPSLQLHHGSIFKSLQNINWGYVIYVHIISYSLNLLWSWMDNLNQVFFIISFYGLYFKCLLWKFFEYFRSQRYFSSRPLYPCCITELISCELELRTCGNYFDSDFPVILKWKVSLSWSAWNY